MRHRSGMKSNSAQVMCALTMKESSGRAIGSVFSVRQKVCKRSGRIWHMLLDLILWETKNIYMLTNENSLLCCHSLTSSGTFQKEKEQQLFNMSLTSTMQTIVNKILLTLHHSEIKPTSLGVKNEEPYHSTKA